MFFLLSNPPLLETDFAFSYPKSSKDIVITKERFCIMRITTPQDVQIVGNLYYPNEKVVHRALSVKGIPQIGCSRRIVDFYCILEVVGTYRLYVFSCVLTEKRELRESCSFLIQRVDNKDS